MHTQVHFIPIPMNPAEPAFSQKQVAAEIKQYAKKKAPVYDRITS